MLLALIIAPTTVHNEQRVVGDVVEVDENTFANLTRKGRLVDASEHAPAPAEPSSKKRRK